MIRGNSRLPATTDSHAQGTANGKRRKPRTKPGIPGFDAFSDALPHRGTTFAALFPKKEPMKNTVQHHPSRRQEAAQAAVRQSQGMQEIPVTQITPDDILAEGGPITPATEDGSPTQRQIEQDVVSVNPSADSMESRG